MIFEYMLYAFILIGFFAGIIRGLKKEFFVFVALLISLALVLFTYPLILSLGSIDCPLIDVYDKCSKVLSFIGINYTLFEYIIFGASIFIVSFLIINKIFSLIFFSAKKELKNSKRKKGLFGSVVGLFSGLILGIFVMTILASSNINIVFDGFITKKVVYYLPNLAKIFGLLGELI